MDTIEMPSYLGYCYILRVIDHLSNYGIVGKLKHRNGKEMGDELVRILSSSMIPDVLQSDNGREVSCVSNLLLIFWNLLSRYWYIVYLLKTSSYLVNTTFLE